MRTLSQRIAKLYFQDLLALNARATRRALADSAAAFETHLDALRPAAATPALERRYAQTLALWARCREIIDHSPTREGATALNDLANDLMITTGLLSFLLERQSAGSEARLVDLSMRQAMLAQRLAKLYLARRLLGDAAASHVDVEQARREFKTAWGEIAGATDNTQRTRDALELALGQWIFFERAVTEGDRGDERLALHVATTSERIAEAMHDVVRSYEATDSRSTLAVPRSAQAMATR